MIEKYGKGFNITVQPTGTIKSEEVVTDDIVELK